MTRLDIERDPASWFTSAATSTRVVWGLTSGSTGPPLRCPLDQESQIAENVAVELFRRAVGWRPRMKPAYIRVIHPPLRRWQRIARRIFGTDAVKFHTRQLNPGNAQQVVETLRRERVEFLSGNPSALLLLAEVIRQKQLECSVPLLWVFGEQLTDAAARTIEQAFHGRVYCDYGAAETTLIGAECPLHNGYHLDLTRHWVGVLSGERLAEPGEVGEIAVTHFRNSAAPIVRYRIGDLGALSDPMERCPCGNPFPRLSEILGRVREVVHTPSGQRISEFFFGNLADLLNSAHEHFTQYRVIQRELDLLEILWVPRHDRAHESLPDIEAKLVERAGTAIRIHWRAVETIPADRSGKRSRFVPLGRVQTGDLD